MDREAGIGSHGPASRYGFRIINAPASQSEFRADSPYAAYLSLLRNVVPGQARCAGAGRAMADAPASEAASTSLLVVPSNDPVFWREPLAECEAAPSLVPDIFPELRPAPPEEAAEAAEV